MEAYLQDLITQSLAFTLMVVLLVAFLESLALVGLLLPGTVMMASIGALIGSGKVDFYYAWAAGIVGCLLGDWISYFVGRAFKGPLHRWSFLKKNKALLDKTEHALHQHSMATILIGRFVGPTRPLVPMVAGMLSAAVQVCLAEHHRLPDLAAGLFLPWHPGGRGDRHSRRRQQRDVQVAAARRGTHDLAGCVAELALVA